jgi:cysteine synthase A
LPVRRTSRYGAAAPPLRLPLFGAEEITLLLRSSVADAVGRTPLIKLRRASEETGCTILGKAEFMNPGQSVKDRTALGIISDAIDRGRLKPGGTIVEGTAGNTGIGLTILANSLGCRTVIVIPSTQSQEKKETLRLLGAELVEVPAVPYRDPNNYVHYSQRLAEALDKSDGAGAVGANQFDNIANRHIHETTTAEEIWSDTAGRIDGFVAAVGSGGTLGGVARALKAKRADVRIALADPPGSALYAYYTTGTLKAEGSSITEGIGQGRITANLEGAPVDTAYRIPDDEALRVVFDLLAEEGLCVGASSGVNVAGAMRLARDLGPGHTIVTILCDPGTRYQSRLFDAAYLRARSLPVPAWLAREPRALPQVFTEAKQG